MITKEQLVCSLPQCVVLKTLGAGHVSIFEWVEHRDQHGKLYVLEDNYNEGIPAFTSAELMDKIKWTWFSRLKAYGCNYDPKKLADILIKQL